MLLADGEIPYDSLIVASGMTHHYFGHEEWARHAPGLKTIEDATQIRSRVLRAFEAAERETHPATRLTWLTFVIIGGGPTGVELAGAIAELARHSMRRDFRRIDAAGARVLLLEGGDRILPGYPADLSTKATKSLARLGVEVRTATLVTDVSTDQVTVSSGERSEMIATRTPLWAAGMQASAFGRAVAASTGADVDRTGRILVAPDLTVAGHPEIFVIGDLAHFARQRGTPLAGVAPVAMSQGRYAGDVIRKRLSGATPRPFRYIDKGQLATIGRAAGVANFGRLRFSGYPAWLLWLFVHLMYLVEFENRVLIFIQWAWNYLSWQRGARLIAHDERVAPDD